MQPDIMFMFAGSDVQGGFFIVLFCHNQSDAISTEAAVMIARNCLTIEEM